MEALRERPRRGRGLSLRTLIVLRWLAVVGQTCAILTAYFALHFPLPLWECLLTIGAGVAMNLATMARARRVDGSLPNGLQTATQLGFDILQLATLLALTGGLDNPFCLLLVAPVTIAAASLPSRQALVLGVMALIALAVLFSWSLPLPWRMHEHLVLPPLYRFGMGLALATGVLFTSGYAWKVAADAEKLELALATTQDVLQREQRLAALGGLAAAAAHELGTPLATIQVVAKELLRASPPDSPVAEDAALMLQQAERCRDILKQLSAQPEEGDALVVEERGERPDGVGPAAHAGADEVGQSPGEAEDLGACLVTDHALEVAHQGREGVGSRSGAEDVVGGLHIGDPVAERLVDGVLEGLGTLGDGHDLRAEHLHARDVEVLAFGVLASHVDRAVQAHEGRRRGGGDAVLAGARLRDDAGLAELLGEECLAQHVVDLVGTRVVEVLPLEEDAHTAQVLLEAVGLRQQGGAPRVVTQQGVQAGAEVGIVPQALPGAVQLLQGAHEGLGDESPTELPEVRPVPVRQCHVSPPASRRRHAPCGGGGGAGRRWEGRADRRGGM